jgi:hypothetical protein
MNPISNAAYEGDIVLRLRNWRGLHLAHSGDLFEEAAGEIERLRASSPEIRNLERMRDMLLEERKMWRRTHMTLTDEEREAVEWFSHFGRPQNGPVIGKHADTLRSLLARLA